MEKNKKQMYTVLNDTESSIHQCVIPPMKSQTILLYNPYVNGNRRANWSTTLLSFLSLFKQTAAAALRRAAADVQQAAVAAAIFTTT